MILSVFPLIVVVSYEMVSFPLQKSEVVHNLLNGIQGCLSDPFSRSLTMSKWLTVVLTLITFLAPILHSNSSSSAPYAQPPIPQDNPIKEAKVRLGKALFFDLLLSGDGTISHNSCQNVFGSGTDNWAFSMGIRGKLGGRSTPKVWNAAFISLQKCADYSTLLPQWICS